MTSVRISSCLLRCMQSQVGRLPLDKPNQAQIIRKKVNGFRLYSSTSLSPSEKMTETLKHKFPLAKQIEVVDVSGGCGSMYEIFVESVEFKGLSMVKQHRMINEILKDEIKQMHGLRIQTRVPEEKG